MNKEKELLATVAGLESKVDHLEAELLYMDDLLLRCGFPEGLNTLKEAVEEMLAEEQLPPHSQ